jgi:hypothetical protein
VLKVVSADSLLFCTTSRTTSLSRGGTCIYFRIRIDSYSSDLPRRQRQFAGQRCPFGLPPVTIRVAGSLQRDGENVPSKPNSTIPRNAAHYPTRQTRGSKNTISVVSAIQQLDEDVELEKKSHNRHCWLPDLPLGELDFKRHAAPIWKSFC